jgi:hypothetical protein
MPKENKNQNGKSHIEMKITGMKSINISKKTAKIDKLQKFPEGTSQKENLQNWSFTGITKQHQGEEILSLGPI